MRYFSSNTSQLAIEVSFAVSLHLRTPFREVIHATVVGCFCFAHNVKSLEPATGLCPRPPSSLLQHLVAIALFDCVRYLVALPFHAYLKRNSDINSNKRRNVSFFKKSIY